MLFVQHVRTEGHTEASATKTNESAVKQVEEQRWDWIITTCKMLQTHKLLDLLDKIWPCIQFLKFSFNNSQWTNEWECVNNNNTDNNTFEMKKECNLLKCNLHYFLFPLWRHDSNKKNKEKKNKKEKKKKEKKKKRKRRDSSSSDSEDNRKRLVYFCI